MAIADLTDNEQLILALAEREKRRRQQAEPEKYTGPKFEEVSKPEAPASATGVQLGTEAPEPVLDVTSVKFAKAGGKTPIGEIPGTAIGLKTRGEHPASRLSTVQKILTPGRTPLTAPLEIPGAAARVVGAIGEDVGILPTMRQLLNVKPAPKRTFSEQAQRMETGLLEPVREKTRELTGNKLIRGGVNLATGILEDPTVAVTGLAGAGRKAISKIPVKGVPRKLLTTEAGLKLTPAQAAKSAGLKEAEKLAGKELGVQASPVLKNIPGKTTGENLALMEGKLNVQARKIGSKPAGQAEAAARGERLQEAAGETQKKLGSKFEQIESEAVTPFREKPILGEKTTTMRPSLIETPSGKPAMVPVQEFKSNAVSKVDEMLSEIGHKVGEPVKNTGGVPSKAINKALKYRDDISQAESLQDLINVRRNIAEDVFEKQKKGIFVGDRSQNFLQRINGKLNDAIAETLESVGSKEMADLYKMNNELFSKNIKLFQSIGKKLGLKEGVIQQDLIKKINALNVEDLNKLRQIKDESISKPLFDELRKGSFESYLINSTIKSGEKAGQVSAESVITQWNKIDSGVKNALFDYDFISDMDKLIDAVKKAQVNNIDIVNRSGTAKTYLAGKAGILKALWDGLSYIGVKHYYKTGKNIPQSFMNLARDAAGKTMMTAENLKELRKAAAARVTIEEMFGLKDGNKKSEDQFTIREK